LNIGDLDGVCPTSPFTIGANQIYIQTQLETPDFDILAQFGL